MEFRQASNSELDKSWEIIREARQFLKDQGIDQWQKEYPNRDTIAEDVEKGSGYVLTEHDLILGYVCISFEWETAYETLRGAWKSTWPCAVVHRLAIAGGHKGKGLASLMFHHTEELCKARGIHSIKIDTDMENGIMKHLLEKNGYSYCGVITFDNSDKIAYEKLI